LHVSFLPRGRFDRIQPDRHTRIVLRQIRNAIELEVPAMALRIVILISSLAVPSTRPLDRDAAPAGARDRHFETVMGLSPSDGCSRSRAARCDDPVIPSPLLSESAESDSDGLVHVSAATLRGSSASDLADSPTLTAQITQHAARRSSGRIPLRC
jgi:hypothetical protein